MTVIEGSFTTLLCESSGIPPPSLTWMKDGKFIYANTSQQTTARDCGMWKCILAL